MSPARFSIAVCLILGSMGIAFASPNPHTPTHWHSSPDSGLEYQFGSPSGRTDDPITDFAILTDAGTLHGSVSEGEDWAVSVLWLDGTHQGVTATIQLTPDPDIHQVTLDYGALGTMFYEWHETAEMWKLVGHTVSDCGALRDSAIYRAILEAWESFRTDLEVSVLPPPSHQEFIWQVLTVSAKPPRLVEDCWGFLVPNTPVGCGAENPDFAGCAECCDRERQIAGICRFGFQFCPPKWCKKAGEWICGGLAKLESAYCRKSACAGKPGDPNCPELGKPLCEWDGGICRMFCSMGECSRCGECDRERPACCGPC